MKGNVCGTNGNDVEQKGMKDLLLFAGIEPTGTMFQTINNKRQLNMLKESKTTV